MAELVALSLLGGLLALDGTSVAQVMVSRPIVAGWLTGWVLGAPAGGFAMGLLLELYLLVSFPVGGTRFPEGAPATVIAVATASWSALPGSLALGLAMGLIWGQLGGLTITGMRFLNSRTAPAGEALPSPRRVTLSHLGGILVDFVRASLLTLAGVLTGRLLVIRLASFWPLDGPATRGLLLLGGMVSLGILLRSFGALRLRTGLLAAGGVVGGLLVGWLL